MRGFILKTKSRLAIATALALPFQAFADHEELPTIVIEGSAMRPGTFGAAPDSSDLTDTAALLKRVPGANVNRNGPLTGIAQYRGMAGNRININLDGANMKEVGPNSMDPPLSHIPAPLTGSLQVYRGIAPVSSGIETLGGSMKAESKKGHFAEGDGLETNGMASMGYSSSADGYYGVLLGTAATKNHKLYLSGSQEKGRDYRIRNNDKQVPTQYDRDAFTTGYNYQKDGHEFGINYSNNNTGNTGTPALPMDIMYIRGGLYDANYNWDLGNGFKLKTNLYYQKMRHLMNNFTLRERYTRLAPAAFRQNRTNVEAGGWDLAMSMPLFNGDMSFGFNGDQANHDALISNPNNAAFYIQNFNGIERDRYSIFSEWKGGIADNLSVELGARLTYAMTDSADVSTSINLPPVVALVNNFNGRDRKKEDLDVDLVSILRYAAASNFDIELGLARKNRMPSYQERYLWMPLEATSGLADGRNYIGDIDLDHETAYQFELGFDWHNDRAYMAPRVFYHYVYNYIQGLASTNAAANMVSINNSGNPALQFSNIDAQLYGVDLEGGYTLDDNWRLDAGLNYVRGQRLDVPGEENLYRMAPLNGRTQLTYENAGWMGAIEGVFYARQGDVSTFNNELKTPGYALLNLRGSYEPVTGLVVSTGVENVTDKKHFDHLGGIDRVNLAITGDRNRIAMPGRNFYATLSYKW